MEPQKLVRPASATGARLSMFRPGADRIRTFVDNQRRLDFTYRDVGATETIDEAGADYVYGDFNVDRRRVKLGRGGDVYRRACKAVKNWQMFDLDWVDLCWPNARLSPGSAVAILVKVAGTWVLAATRIVYVIDKTGDVERFGFGYGTLPGHMMVGEERFLIEHDRETDVVSFEILAASKPGPLISWLGYPVIRRLQNRFRRESTALMQAAVLR